MLSGPAAVLFGSIFLVSPAKAVVLLRLVAAHAFVMSAFLIGMGFKMRADENHRLRWPSSRYARF